ncbi:unnamed protein product [Rhodiola kirilowii]
MSLQLLLPSPPLTCNHKTISSPRSCRPLSINCKAKKDSVPTTTSDASSSSSTLLETLAIAGGLISTPVVAWSLYTLKTTGCGLPPGPAGSIGALEGVSYLAVFAIVGWSAYTKAKTGSGLPNGPFGLLGAVEGFSYLSLLAVLLVFGVQFIDTGSLPGPLPSDQCFG